MNTERLLRDVEKRLSGLAEPARDEVLGILREEFGRERRRLDPTGTAEKERERRVEAETLREILEAINRQARLEDTIAEVLKQLARIVVFDACSLSIPTPDGSFRVIAVRGVPEPARVIGQVFRDALTDTVRDNNWPITVTDVLSDERFLRTEGRTLVRSWAGIPLLVEGEVIGLLCLSRHRVEPFEEEDLHRARAVAFSAAAAVRKAQLLEQVRRFAALMEQLVSVDQVVFSDQPAAAVGRAILESAHRIGSYQGGLLILDRPEGARVLAATGPFAAATGKPAPAELTARTSGRLPLESLAPILASLGVSGVTQPMYLVPFQTADAYLGTLALVDPDGDTPDDRLMEAFASRAAAALLHTLRRG